MAVAFGNPAVKNAGVGATQVNRMYAGSVLVWQLVSAPSITSPLTAAATVGVSFSYTITASDYPTSYDAVGLPPGLSVDTLTGVISGIPTTEGTSSVTISAANSAGTGTATLSLTVQAAVPNAPVVTSPTTATATVNVAFNYTITATNSPTSFNATGLPAGLSVNTSTGVISGTPTTSGTSSVTISASNAGGTGTATLSLTVQAATTSANVTTRIIANATASRPKLWRISSLTPRSPFDSRYFYAVAQCGEFSDNNSLFLFDLAVGTYEHVGYGSSLSNAVQTIIPSTEPTPWVAKEGSSSDLDCRGPRYLTNSYVPIDIRTHFVRGTLGSSEYVQFVALNSLGVSPPRWAWFFDGLSNIMGHFSFGSSNAVLGPFGPIAAEGLTVANPVGSAASGSSYIYYSRKISDPQIVRYELLRRSIRGGIAENGLNQWTHIWLGPEQTTAASVLGTIRDMFYGEDNYVYWFNSDYGVQRINILDPNATVETVCPFPHPSATWIDKNPNEDWAGMDATNFAGRNILAVFSSQHCRKLNSSGSQLVFSATGGSDNDGPVESARAAGYAWTFLPNSRPQGSVGFDDLLVGVDGVYNGPGVPLGDARVKQIILPNNGLI